MDTDDDPLTLAVIGGVVFAGVQAGKSGGVDIPKTEALQASKEAEPLSQATDEQKKRKRLKSSLLTEGFGRPKLGIPGLEAIGKSATL